MSWSARAVPAWLTITAAVLAFIVCMAAWLGGGAAVDVAWAPSLGLRLAFELDGLAALYALLASGVGVAVFLYARAYLPLHLEHEGRPAVDARRFWPWMALFLAAMVGLALAQDLVVLFVLFDLTAICSYFLIGFDRHSQEARTAALMALIVTCVSAIALLVGAVILYAQYGTFSIPALVARAGNAGVPTIAAALIVVAALAKSAQVPLHFWLPAAMAAPTPVSAYLHSAAMVAAGVLVLGRLHPLLSTAPAVLDGLLVVGVASTVIGGLLAMARDRLKQVLAYSTIAQYGYVVTMYGIGGEAGTGGAAFYVVAHGLAKSALFMTAGAVTMATGEDRLSRLGGLLSRMPLLGAACAVAAATLAALPLTLGFFKDELFFAAALEGGRTITVFATVGAALTVAYIARFWAGLFLGPLQTGGVRRVPWLLVAPTVVLAGVLVGGGVLVEPFAALASAAGSVSHAGAVELTPGYHLDTRPENLMAVTAWTLGGLAFALRRTWMPATHMLAAAGRRGGPRRAYSQALALLDRLSARLHVLEVRDLRNSVAAVLAPGGVVIALALLRAPDLGQYRVGSLSVADGLLIAVLSIVAVAALAVVTTRDYLRMVLALAVVGFTLAAVYGLAGAPDVALVAVVVETVITLVFLSVLARLPRRLVLSRQAPASRRWRDPLIGLLAGSAAFAAIWSFLSQTAAGTGVASELIRLAPSAHGDDVVTIILADFRGLDTLVEITVVAVAIVGVGTLLRRGRYW